MTSYEKYLERHRRYNRSLKGQKRNQRYEEKNPSRKLRWEPARKRQGITSTAPVE
jgi:hypothetical protein